MTQERPKTAPTAAGENAAINEPAATSPKDPGGRSMSSRPAPATENQKSQAKENAEGNH